MPPTPTTDAAVDRPLPVCRRRDLVVQPLWFSQRRKWVVKDPLALAYYYFSDEDSTSVDPFPQDMLVYIWANSNYSDVMAVKLDDIGEIESPE